MAENPNTKGAVHLTSLSLDLTEFNENIKQIEESTAQVANIAVQNLSKIKESLNISNEQIGLSVDTSKFSADLNDAQTAIKGFEKSSRQVSENVAGLSSSFEKATKSQNDFIVRSKDAESLAKAYETIQVKIAGIISSLTASKVKDSGMTDLILRAKETEQQIAATANEIRNTGVVTEKSYDAFQNFKSIINDISISFSHFKTSSNEFKKSLEPIETQTKSTISSLKTLEKSTVFNTSKKKVAELRAEYEEFLNKLKTTNVGTDEAQKKLNELQQKFEQLESTVKKGTTTLENWVNKISESAKWQITNAALNILQQSFGQLTTTIIDTENAVIELKRVLGDKSLADSAISDELYQIAYDFGQTFEAVQEVAIKFAQTGLNWQDTVEATRATMLGLNTAELEVATATEGLIAVMAQFGLQATDLEQVIDKINITADSFPVTSEKIVAALQRAGGTASAFGLSLEETIGIITALGEATGRAGEAIGTAMNSLISFSMKDTALEKFSEFLGKDVSDYGVLELWTELGEAVKGSEEDFASLMSTTEEFGELMNEELATAIGLEEEFSKATEETNQMIKDKKDIYSTVGTYRQNYFIALLNNIDTATNAIQNMSGAIGYSLQENETAMEAFSRKWNQMIISAKELAVQFGEAGFLDLMKGAVEASSAILQLTKSLGGVRTVLIALTTLIIAVKKEKINSFIFSTGGAIKNLRAATELYSETLALTGSRVKAFSGALSALQITMGGWITLAMSAITVISSIAGAINQAKEAAKEARQESISLGLDATDSVRSLTSAYENYNKALESGNLKELNETRAIMLEQLGYEKEDLDILSAKYENIDKQIKQMTEDELALLEAKILVAKQDAIDSFKDIELNFPSSGADNYFALLKEGLNSIGASIDQVETFDELIKQLGVDGIESEAQLYQLFRTPVDNYADAKRVYDSLNEIIKKVFSGTDSEKWTSKQRDAFSGIIGIMTQYVEILEPVIDNYEYLTEVSDTLSEKTENAGNSANTATAEFASLEEEIEALGDKINDLNKKVDSFQSAYKTLTSVIEEYNETGKLSADNLQTLLGLEPEYLALLDNHNGQLSINQERLQDLIATQDQYMDELVALTIAKNIDNMATEAAAATTAGLIIEQYKAKIATQDLQSTTYILVKQLLDGKISANDFKNGIANIGTQAGATGEVLGEFTNRVVDMTNAMAGFYSVTSQTQHYTLNDALAWGYTDPSDPEFIAFMKKRNAILTGTVNTNAGNISRYYAPSSSKSSGSSGSSSDPYKAEKDALNELLEIYEHSIFLLEKNGGKAEDIAAIYRKMQEEVHAQAEKYRASGVSETDELIRNLQEKWWQYEEEIEEVIHDIYEESVKSYENAINILEHQYDSAAERLDYSYMGENLKRQLDYQVKIQSEAERELERLAEKGMEANDNAAQDVIDTWYEAEKSIREISQKIQESILQPYEEFIDFADKFDIWEYMDFTKVDYLRMELQEINNMLADGTMSLKEYNEQLKEISYAIFDAQKDLFEKQKDDIENAKDNVVEAYKADVDSLKNQKDEVNNYYDSVIDGYESEIDIWEKRKDSVEDYYDKLIDNLNEVQEANERINAQIDYYNNRQKIITNLEQAQARSGVEWREKEMEYQQQLIDLDEEWNRTQKEWNIQDQIDSLEKLKEMALADIDLSIQAIRDTITAAEEAKKAAIDSIEAEIAGIESIIDATEKQAEEEIALIDAQIKELSQTIAEAIKNGTADGIVNSQAELDQALVDGTNAMLGFIDSTNQTFVDSSQETASIVYGAYDTSFITPMYNSIDGIISHMQSAIPAGATSAAQQALIEFDKALVAPLKEEMANLMSTSNSLQNSLNSLSTSYSNLSSGIKNPINLGVGPITTTAQKTLDTTSGMAWTKPGLTPFKETATNVFITNNNVGANASSIVQRNQQQLAQILGSTAGS